MKHTKHTRESINSTLAPRQIVMLDEYIGAKAKSRFKCQHGHEWEAVTESVRRGNGCPHCMGYHQTAESLNADIAQYGIKLIGPLGKMNGKALFECQHGHQFESIPTQIKRGVSGCPFCAGRRQSKETINAELEGRGLRMIGDYKGQRIKTLFECDSGHQWEVVPMNIRRGTGCPYCTGRAGHSTETVNALLAPRGIKMLTPYRTGSKARATFLCPEGHEWQATIASVKGGNGCSVCVGRGQTLEDVNALLAPRGFTLLTDFKALRQKGTFRCAHGHEWSASISYVKDGGGCPYCAGQAGHTRETFLEAIQGRDIELVGDYVDLSTNTQFQCQHGHIWTAKPQKIKVGGGCPHCLGLYQTKDSVNVELEPRGIQIIGEFKNISSRALFRATCGHEWRSKVFEVKGGTGCPKCATGGIRSQDVAYVYVLDYGNGLVKIGSSGQLQKRLKQLRLAAPKHLIRTIKLVALYQFEDGSGLAAAEWEKRAHDELAHLGAGLLGFSGSTELFRMTTAEACELLWRLGGRFVELIKD
ncbi:TPA: zinc-ribbon domain-containing protein [Escherichia coli]